MSSIEPRVKKTIDFYVQQGDDSNVSTKLLRLILPIFILPQLNSKNYENEISFPVSFSLRLLF